MPDHYHHMYPIGLDDTGAPVFRCECGAMWAMDFETGEIRVIKVIHDLIELTYPESFEQYEAENNHPVYDRYLVVFQRYMEELEGRDESI